jgi:hypothetical protein
MLCPMKNAIAVPSRGFRRVVASLVVLLSITVLGFLHPGLARAGTLQVKDTAAVLSSADRSQIQAAVARYPFDVRVLTSSAYADQAGFSRYVGAQVNEANEVVVGFDPVHHHTQVHFGTGSHVAQSSWGGIERAGNNDFRDSRWGAGVVAVLDQASAAVTMSGAAPPDTSSSSGSFFGFGSLIALLIVVALPIIGIMVIVAIARRLMGGPRVGYGGPGYGGPGYGGPGYGGGGPGYGGPGYGGGGGMGPVGGGLIGAGLGGVAGYELGKMEGERERGGDNGGGFGGGSSNDGGGSFDAGGGGSSWDGGGGGDSGGGGDFGGGGGDSGGGDSGGGGSDW